LSDELRQHSGRGPVIVTCLALGAAMLLGAAGITADAPRASAAQVTRAVLRYTCRFPAGSYRVNVVVSATVQAAAHAGSQIQPTGVRLAAQLPSPVAGLSGYGQATGALTVIEASRGNSAKASWPVTGRHVASGILLLDVRPPVVIASRPGLVTFTAGSLVLTLIHSGGAVTVDCAASRPASFATVTVSPATSRAARPAGRSGIPKGCGKIKVVANGVATCAYVTGYTEVAKLIGAALLQPRSPVKPGLVNVDLAEKTKFKPGKLIEVSTGQLLYRGHHELPPVTATFIAFRFVPVTATLHLTELTSIAILSVSGDNAPPYPIKVRSTTKISVRVSSVRVNGVPLNVGGDCRTASPVKIVLIGTGQNTLPPKGYTLTTGGPLSGDATIPPFTGCGTTENLDPLLTGSISGRGNFTKLIQGKLCGPANPSAWACPPPVPKPRR